MTASGIEVFWASGSCPSWRVMLALELKGVPYTAHLLEFSRREQKAAEHLARNPRGKVPVLRHGDFVLYESLAILAYLERCFPDPPLLGTTPRETGLAWRLLAEAVFYMEPAVDEVCLPIYRGKALERADEVRAGAAKVHAELARLEARLATTPWLLGDSPTAADLGYVPLTEHLVRAGGKPGVDTLDLAFLPLGARHPAVAAWLGRVESLPGFDRTYPPHWR